MVNAHPKPKHSCSCELERLCSCSNILYNNKSCLLTRDAHFTLLLPCGHLIVSAAWFNPARLCPLWVTGALRFLQHPAGVSLSARHLQLVLDLLQPALQPLDLFVPVGHHPLVLMSPGTVYTVQHVYYRVYRQPDGVFHHQSLLVAEVWVQSSVSDQIHLQNQPVMMLASFV